MIEWLFETELWPARRECGAWPAWLVYTTVFGNFITMVAYFLISGLFTMWRTTSVRQKALLTIYSMIFFTCGMGHFLGGVIVFWIPIYRVIALWSVLTALVGMVGVPLLINSVVSTIDELMVSRTTLDLLRKHDPEIEELIRQAKKGQLPQSPAGGFNGEN